MYAALFLAAFSSFQTHAMGKKKVAAEPAQIPEDPPLPSGALELRVLSYNVQGLPPPIGADLDRMTVIGKILAENRKRGGAPQIVLLQEAWFEKDSDELIRNAGYPYVVKGPGTHFGKVVGAGIYILSEFPLSEYSELLYDDCIGPDCYASKGAMRVRVHIPGLPEPFYVFNTHLNADSEPLVSKAGSMAVRMRQLNELHTWRALLKMPAGPKLFGGDFNFTVGNRDFEFLSRTSSFKDAHQACIESRCSTVDTDFREDLKTVLDHQFFDQGRQVQIKPIHLEKNYRELYRGEPLSDHLALEVHYRIQW